MPNKSTYLGIIQDVQGATVNARLDSETASGLAFLDGHGYRIGQIGSFIRIPIGFTDLFGIVSHIGAGAVPENLIDIEPHGLRWMRIQLIGEGPRSGEFKRGITQYPTIGDEVHLVTQSDLARIYGRQSQLNLVRVGSVASAESIPALIDIDKLVTRHSAVVGTTGAGKSTTVAGLLATLTDTNNYPSARIVVLDIHDEYGAALGDRSTIFKINADKAKGEEPLCVPYWALSFDELLKVTPFYNSSDSDKRALVEIIRDMKSQSITKAPLQGITEETLTVDTPVPFSIHKLWYDLYRLVCSHHTAPGTNQNDTTQAFEPDEQGNPILGDALKVIPPKYRPITSGGGQNRVYLSGAPLNISRQIHALQALLRDTRYDFLFRPGPWCPDVDGKPSEDLDTLIKAWIGGDKPIAILDLSGVPVSILMNLVGVVIRLLFEALFWARFRPEGGRERPLLFVLEEAHAYLSAASEGPAAISAKRVVKEGRKYGIGALIVSQRPSEVDATIMSQCGTIFAMRLANASDRSHVTSTVSDNLEGLFNMLPTLRTGEAIIVGEAVHLPMRAVIDTPAPNRLPDSHDPKIVDPKAMCGWNRKKEKEDYAKVIESWRSEKIN